MERKDIEVGDRVMITDGSQATRLDEYVCHTHIGLCKHEFEVLWISMIGWETTEGFILHDIHIKDMENGRIYLHSSSMVRASKPTEMTMKDLTALLGYEVKIVK